MARPRTNDPTRKRVLLDITPKALAKLGKQAKKNKLQRKPYMEQVLEVKATVKNDFA